MTKTEIRDELKRLHPDQRGGDHSHVVRLTKLVKILKGPICPGCGKPLHSTAISKKQNIKRKHCSQLCDLISRSRRRLELCAVIVFTATLCFGAGFPDLQKALQRAKAKHKPTLRSPRAMGEMANALMAVPQYIPQDLMWEYDLPLPRDVTFVVLMAKTPNGPWSTFIETNQPPVRVTPRGYYKVETRNNL